MLSRETVKDIALLARIGLEEGEVEKYQKDLSSILDFFAELEKVDTSEVASLGHITGRTGDGREDRFEQSEKEGQNILKNVPEMKEGFIKVRSVF